MLESLKVYNYVIIKDINITFDSGFNVFTGETGTGKSLLVDSLQFISGERASNKFIGPYDNYTYVEAEFLTPKLQEFEELLRQNGLRKESSIILSRELREDGRSIARFNGRVITISLLKEISFYLVDIHTQHQNNQLFTDHFYLRLLDDLIDEPQIIMDFKSSYNNYLESIENKKRLEKNILSPEELDFAQYQLNELIQLDPSVEDYESTQQDLKEAEEQIKYIKYRDSLKQSLDQALTAMYEVNSILDKARIDDSYSRIFKDAYYSVEDYYNSFISESSNLEINDHLIDKLNERLFEYSQVIRKYGSIESVIEKKHNLENQISYSKDYDHLRLHTDKLIKEKKNIAHSKAMELRNARINVARKLESEIKKELKDLMFDDLNIKFSFKDKDISSNGIDCLTLKVSFNKGMPLQKISEIASGGELSRFMLGLKSVLSQHYRVSTMILDEIDTGVSGQSGKAIAKKMKSLSKSFQIISITHLAPVAAYADQQYLISKIKRNNQNVVESQIELLDYKERVRQLAIMMSSNLDKSSLQTAENLLQEGQGSL